MTVIFIILAFVCGAILYRVGLADGQALAEGRKIRCGFPKKTKKTEAEERIKKGVENILDYANRKYKG